MRIESIRNWELCNEHQSLETLETWKNSKILFDSLGQNGEKLTQLINGYIGYLKRSEQGQNEPGSNHHIRDDIALYDVDPFESPKAE